MTREEIDLLIDRSLAGTAGAEDIRTLDEILRTDPEAREALLTAADLDASLRSMFHREAYGLEDLSPPGAPTRSRRARRRLIRAESGPRLGVVIAGAAAALLLVILVFAAGSRPAHPPPRTPAPEARLPEPEPSPDPAPVVGPDPRRQPPTAPPRRDPRPDVEDVPRRAVVQGPAPSVPTPSRPDDPAPAPSVRTPAPVVPAPAPETRPAVAVVQDVKGSVRRNEAPVRAGESLLEGDALDVGLGATALIRYADGTLLELPEGTRLRGFSNAQGKRLEVESGTIRAEVAKQARPMAFATPHAEATVLGTTLRLVVGPENTRLEVTEGRVRLTREGKSVDVTAGHFAVAAADVALAVRPLPVDEIVLVPRDGRIAGAAWQFARDPQASTGIALDASRTGSFEWKGDRMVATAPQTYVDFTFTADADRDYHVWVRGRTLADPSQPVGVRQWHDSVVLEAPGGAWSRPCAWMTASGFARMHRFDGYRARDGYWWLGGNHEATPVGPVGGDETPVAVRFIKPGRQGLRLYVSEAPVRIDAIWLSTTQKTRPADADVGPGRRK